MKPQLSLLFFSKLYALHQLPIVSFTHSKTAFALSKSSLDSRQLVCAQTAEKKQRTCIQKSGVEKKEEGNTVDLVTRTNTNRKREMRM